jgi:dipeptidyl aminopeptidase/acylaminoacyl peptidase
MSQSPFLEELPFTLHRYEDLRPSDQAKFTPEQYQDLQKWYAALSDAEFKRIWYASDSYKITGILGLPKPLAANKKYPIIIYNRGGSNDDGKMTVATLKDSFYSWIKAGYIVAASQYRGNDGGQGKDELAGADVMDVVNLYECVKQLPYVDQNNIFMIGYSRGAMMATAAIKAGVSVNALAMRSGVLDLIAFEENRPDTKELLHSLIHYSPETKEAEFKKRSAIFWSDAIKVPTLLIHGDADPICHVSQSQRFATALEKQGTPHKLIIYPGGDHFLKEQTNDFVPKILEWFERNYYEK